MKLIPFQLEEGCYVVCRQHWEPSRPEGYRQMYINLEELARMEKASYLLPDPGGEVVRSLIAESRRFRLIGVRILNETTDPQVKNLIHLALYDSPYTKDGINKG